MPQAPLTSHIRTFFTPLQTFQLGVRLDNLPARVKKKKTWVRKSGPLRPRAEMPDMPGMRCHGPGRCNLVRSWTSRSGRFLESTLRSCFGLCSVYNILPAEIVECCSSVSALQGELQALAMKAALMAFPDWQRLFSPRHAMFAHPLLRVRTLLD